MPDLEHKPERTVFGRLENVLTNVFGPPDLGPEYPTDPLRGTKYDPELKKARREARREARRHRTGH